MIGVERGGAGVAARSPRGGGARLVLLGLVVAAVVLIRAASADAGTFVLESCPGDAGWGGASTSALFTSYVDGCASGGTAGLSMTMGPDPYASLYSQNTGGAFSFSVPSQYTLTGYSLSGSAFDGWCALGGVATNCEHYGEGQVVIAPTGPGDDSPDFDELGQNGQAISLGVSGLDATGLSVTVGCNGGAYNNPCPTNIDGGAEASVTISSAAFWLASNASPTASGFDGSLLDPNAHGTADLTFTANDPSGPGVYNVKVLIDSKPAYSGTPNTNAGACASSGSNGGDPVFASFQPCLQSESVDIPIDTTALSDGPHELKVIVSDAAGNTATVLDRTITTANLTTVSSLLPSTPSSASAAVPVYAFVLDKATGALSGTVRRSFKHSALTFSGTLDSQAGVPAPGVPVAVWSSPPGGAGFSVLTQTTTDGAGRWSLVAPAGASRVLRVIAGTGALPSSAASAVSVTETVTPNLSLKIGAPGGAKLVFKGRIGISPLGSPRPLVFIEVKGPSGWQSVGSPVRVGANGRYRYVYASSPYTVGRRFVFRAVTPAVTLWPSTASRTTSAVVR